MSKLELDKETRHSITFRGVAFKKKTTLHSQLSSSAVGAGAELSSRAFDYSCPAADSINWFSMCSSILHTHVSTRAQSASIFSIAPPLQRRFQSLQASRRGAVSNMALFERRSSLPSLRLSAAAWAQTIVREKPSSITGPSQHGSRSLIRSRTSR